MNGFLSEYDKKDTLLFYKLASVHTRFFLLLSILSVFCSEIDFVLISIISVTI